MTTLRAFFLYALVFRVVGAFVATSLSTGRTNAVYARGWGTHIGHVRRGIPRPSQPAAVPPHMSVLLVDVESPISSETQETVVSILSLGSSVLFVIVILGTAYLTYMDWSMKREANKVEEFIARTGETPEMAIGKESSEDDDGNRLFRRMAAKEKQKLEKD